MGVKRFHKTTRQEFTDVLVAWKQEHCPASRPDG
jgi:hypothetical protein